MVTYIDFETKEWRKLVRKARVEGEIYGQEI